MTTRSPLDKMQAIGTLLIGIAAIAALLFTWQSVHATNGQLQATEQGQITDRYTAAITDLGSQSTDVRLGGIYALQRIMQDSPRDQPTVVAVLCAFVRDHATKAAVTPSHTSGTPQSSVVSSPPTDIQAALTVVTTRDTTHDGSTTVVDFSGANLTGAALTGANLNGANLNGANLTSAILNGAGLGGAILNGANFNGADLTFANLSGVVILAHAHYTGAAPVAHLSANVKGAIFSGANLTGALLIGADLTGADMARANLAQTNVSYANLTGANLTGANLAHADLNGANLTGATLTGVKGLRT